MKLMRFLKFEPINEPINNETVIAPALTPIISKVSEQLAFISWSELVIVLNAIEYQMNIFASKKTLTIESFLPISEAIFSNFSYASELCYFTLSNKL